MRKINFKSPFDFIQACVGQKAFVINCFASMKVHVSTRKKGKLEINFLFQTLTNAQVPIPVKMEQLVLIHMAPTTAGVQLVFRALIVKQASVSISQV